MNWLVRMVRFASNRWDAQCWKGESGLMYETRRNNRTGEIQVKHLNFAHGDGGKKWHALETARKSEQLEIENFYQSNKPL